MDLWLLGLPMMQENDCNTNLISLPWRDIWNTKRKWDKRGIFCWREIWRRQSNQVLWLIPGKLHSNLSKKRAHSIYKRSFCSKKGVDIKIRDINCRRQMMLGKDTLFGLQDNKSFRPPIILTRQFRFTKRLKMKDWRRREKSKESLRRTSKTIGTWGGKFYSQSEWKPFLLTHKLGVQSRVTI